MSQISKVPVRFLAAFSFGCPKSIRDFLDDELAWRLLKSALAGNQASIQQLDFIARFNEEFHRSYFRDGKKAKTSLHKTPTLQRKLQDSINSKRKDLWGSRSRRVPLSSNNAYPDTQTMAYRAAPSDGKLIAAVSEQALTRAEIIAHTGLKQWVVYARIKSLLEYGLIKGVKKEKKSDLIRFISTKSLS